ncbi:RNA-binding protein 41 [Ornithorhynchus anatinus]|uniref:RNA-binding protein 41 n=1 Tax=Ornithorhynchus anatinus TaxID=9258 RepID=A0A6I8MX65_ORNAN|nr:RNA-binding protein 41 [Ornithorhynchus anatinus]
MKRVSSSMSSDDIVLEDLETEGERQLRSPLHHQLDTSVSIEECLSKRQCFAPAALYKPFGEVAAGALTLSQFQALQESDRETASLRELGLTDAEISLWKNRASEAKSAGLGAAPEATLERLRNIEEKISERQRILSLPQRFAGSKQLNRREMEIENALFQGTDRHSFLRALYYQDEARQRVQKDPMSDLETVYQEILTQTPQEPHDPTQVASASRSAAPEAPGTPGRGREAAEDTSEPRRQDGRAAQDEAPGLPGPETPQHASAAPRKVTEPVAFVPEDEIRRNRLSEEEIRKIPRFSSYSPGEPSKVLYLKNLSPRVTGKELVSLFAQFQEKEGPQIQFRLLTGRMRGQAFITFPSTELAQQALLLVNGFNLLGKTLVIEFGKNKMQPTGLLSAPLPAEATSGLEKPRSS